MTTHLEYPIYLFNEGTNAESYELLQSAYVVKNKRKGWRFRCWAPNAKSVSVVGDFNEWDRKENRMTQIGGGIWECHIRGLKKFDIYKFSIETADGNVLTKSDPFATHAETPPANASKIFDLGGFKWRDKDYFEALKSRNHQVSPINIYEVHLGSWKKYADGNFYSYRDMADALVPYVKEMGYTHIELLPVTEYPLDMSWGYQVGGFYAPTSRFGTPHDFMYFVDRCHSEGIGVIMDLVLSHFPKDAFGLYRFDGTPLYEYSDPLKAEHKGWGTMAFDYGKGGVRSFLISCANFWLKYYHIDGLRLDAVASMLYLDYDRKEGEWRPNKDGGNYNLEAISFLQDLNKSVLTNFPNAFTAAEESTAFPMVTMPPSVGGLGFTFKWNMGWMNDILSYEKIDPFFRKGSHNKLTFGITYAFSENFILPFSHDEVVHGKCSMIGKMAGEYSEKFSALKALYAYQFAHPGKKLNFMGNEFGQFIEWDYAKQLDWFLLDYDTHANLKAFNKKLNAVYLGNRALWEQDSVYDGFKWLVVDDSIQNVVALYRESKDGERVVAIINFSDVDREVYSFGVPDEGVYEVILDNLSPEFDGIETEPVEYVTEDKPMHGQKQIVTLELKGNQALYLKLKKGGSQPICLLKNNA